MAIGRRIWSLDTTLHVHLAIAPVVAFVVATIHKFLAADFSSVLRAMVLTGLVVFLDAVVVAPIFERDYAMFRRLNRTWVPFASIFLARLGAAILVPA